MSKKVISILSIAILSVSLLSCDSDVASKKLEKNETTKTTQNDTTQTSKSEASEESKESKEDEALQEVISAVGIQNFAINSYFEESYNTMYYKATITNNSDYALKNISFKYSYVDDEGVKQVTYLSCYDTILAHETSSEVSCFASQQQNLELISVDYQIYNQEKDKNLYVTYDAKLDKYSFM